MPLNVLFLVSTIETSSTYLGVVMSSLSLNHHLSFLCVFFLSLRQFVLLYGGHVMDQSWVSLTLDARFQISTTLILGFLGLDHPQQAWGEIHRWKGNTSRSLSLPYFNTFSFPVSFLQASWWYLQLVRLGWALVNLEIHKKKTSSTILSQIWSTL